MSPQEPRTAEPARLGTVAVASGLPIALLSLGLSLLGAPALPAQSPVAAQEQVSQEAPQQAPQTPEPEGEPQSEREAERLERERERTEERLEEIEERRAELEEQLEEVRTELEELDRRVEEAVVEREQAARDEAGRLEDALRDLEDSRRELMDEGEVTTDREESWRSRSAARELADPKVGFGTTVKVRADEIAEEVFSIGGGAKVEGEVLRDVVTIGGPAKINGRVEGSVSAFGANVELGPGAVVRGDVNSLGGKALVHPGARVDGEINGGQRIDFDVGDFRIFDGRDRLRHAFGWADWVEFFWELLFTGFLIVLCGLVYLVLRRPLERVRDTAETSALKSLLVGFLICALSVPALVTVIIVLAISIIGIPLLVILVLLLPFALLAVVAAVFYGYSGVALAVGGVLRGQLKLGFTSGLVMIAVGVFALRAMTLSGDLLDAIGLPAVVTVLFGFTGFVIQAAAICTGLGAVVLSRFGSATPPSRMAATAPPPDLPPVPEEESESWEDRPSSRERHD